MQTTTMLATVPAAKHASTTMPSTTPVPTATRHVAPARAGGAHRRSASGDDARRSGPRRPGTCRGAVATPRRSSTGPGRLGHTRARRLDRGGPSGRLAHQPGRILQGLGFDGEDRLRVDRADRWPGEGRDPPELGTRGEVGLTLELRHGLHLWLQDERVLRLEMPGLALDVDLVALLGQGADSGLVVREHGGLEGLLVGLPVRRLLAPGRRGHARLVPAAAVEDGGNLAGRGVVPVLQLGMFVGHRAGDLSHGVAGRFRADDAHASGVIGGGLLLDALGGADSPDECIVVMRALVVRLLFETGALEEVAVFEEIVVIGVVGHVCSQTWSSSCSLAARS